MVTRGPVIFVVQQSDAYNFEGNKCCNILQYIAIYCNKQYIDIFIRRIVLYCSSKCCNILIYCNIVVSLVATSVLLTLLHLTLCTAVAS